MCYCILIAYLSFFAHSDIPFSTVDGGSMSLSQCVDLVTPMTTNVTPMTTNVNPMTTNITPMTTNITPMTTNVTPMTTNVTPMTTNITVTPMASDVPSPSNNMTHRGSGGNNVGLIVAVVVGAVLLALAVVGVIVLVIVLIRGKKARKQRTYDVPQTCENSGLENPVYAGL